MAEAEPITPDGGTKAPATSFEKFAGTPIAIIIGIVVGVGLSVLMMCLGVNNVCCIFGMLIVPLFLYYFPKLFGVKKWPFFIVIGLSFMLIATALGGFVIGPKMVHDNEWHLDGGNYFKTADREIDGNDIIITATFEEVPAEIEQNKYCLRYAYIERIAFGSIVYSLGDPVTGTPVPVEPGNDDPEKLEYKVEWPAIKDSANKLVAVALTKDNGVNNETKESSNILVHNGISDNELQMKCLMGAAYTTGLETVLYAVICVLMIIMQRNLDKARAKMEAEGRLYPQGYNRCKECGSIVLPGEVCCRKCGAYIEVPDEIKVKKVESVHCSECGAEIPEKAKYCPRCGATFDEEDEVVEIRQDAKPEEKTEAKPEEKQEEPQKTEEKKE